jgi:uncharacterized protein
MLNRKIEAARNIEHQEKNKEAVEKTKRTGREKSTIETITENTMVRQVGRTLAREIVRGLLGVLGVSTATRRRR